MRDLIFIHGRSQQNKDSVALKSEWIEALQKGLDKSNLQLPIPETSIHFPYYGDTLFQLSSREPPEHAAEVIVRGAAAGDSAQRDFMLNILNEMLNQRGISDSEITAEAADEALVVERGVLNWPWVRAALQVIDRKVPFGSGSSIALFTSDVYHYLSTAGIRDQIDKGVRKAFPAGSPAVVVSHSLGTIVAYSLLNLDGQVSGWQVPLLVTLGSPLAVTAIKKAFRPNQHPTCVTHWFNAMDPRDVVALYPLDQRNFPIDPSVENKTDVRNHTDNRHGIAGYLDDAVVAKRIYDALTAP
jgi:hypothetical protein